MDQEVDNNQEDNTPQETPLRKRPKRGAKSTKEHVEDQEEDDIQEDNTPQETPPRQRPKRGAKSSK